MAKIELDVADARQQVQALRQKALSLRKQGAWWADIPSAIEEAVVTEGAERFVTSLSEHATYLTEAGERLDEIADGVEKTIRIYQEADD